MGSKEMSWYHRGTTWQGMRSDLVIGQFINEGHVGLGPRNRWSLKSFPLLPTAFSLVGARSTNRDPARN